MSLHTHTWEADATKLNSQIPPRATLHPLPRPPRYLFKAKMDLGSGQHMPQKQAYQPQNYDKPRAVNVRGNFLVMSRNFRSQRYFKRILLLSWKICWLKCLHIKTRSFYTWGLVICVYEKMASGPMCLVTLVFFGLHYHDIKPFFRALSYQANA